MRQIIMAEMHGKAKLLTSWLEEKRKKAEETGVP
jgi:hypothetical protein